MPGTNLGVSLLRADADLAALVEDPERLDRERGRFSESPPSYRSHLSHNSTLSQPTPRDEEQRRLEDWQWQLIREHRASFPRSQFEAQASEEYNRLFKPRTSGHVFDSHINKLSEKTVKTWWVEQGIWNDKWGSIPPHSARWKHEEPLEPESDSEAEAGPSVFSFSAIKVEVEPRRPKTDEEIRLAERRAARVREQDSSRPFYQFIYQLSKERERFQDNINLCDPAAPGLSGPTISTGNPVHQTQSEPNAQGAATPTPTPPDINTTAYERVRDTWKKRGIWNRKWGILPGLSWKHELHLEEMIREEMGDDFARLPADAFNGVTRLRGAPAELLIERPAVSNEPSAIPNTSPPVDISRAPRDSGYGAGGTPSTRDIFKAPSPAVSSHPDGMNASLQDPYLATDPGGLPNCNAGHAPAASNSQHRRAACGVQSSPSPWQRRQRGEITLAAKDGQAPQMVRTAFRPVRPSRVSKSRGKTGSATRQQSNLSGSLPQAQQFLHEQDTPATHSESLGTARRSSRLEAARAIARASSTRSEPKRTTTGPKLAGSKPQGVSKRHPRTTRNKSKHND